MSRQFGVDHARTDERGDAFAVEVGRALKRVAYATARATPATPTVLDLAGVRGTWRRQVEDVLVPAVEREWLRAANETWSSVADALREDLHVAVVVGAADVGSQALPEALVNAGTVAVPRVSIEAARAYLATAQNRLTGIGDMHYEFMRAELLAGLELGEGSEVIARRLRTTWQMALPRARVVARTEVIGATNRGAYAQMLSLGMGGTKTWLATGDGRTRPSHAAASGSTVEMTGSFMVGSFPMDGPHDPLGPPEETISCRCTLTYDLDTESSGVSSRVDTTGVLHADFKTNLTALDAARLQQLVLDDRVDVEFEWAQELDALKDKYIEGYVRQMGLTDDAAAQHAWGHGLQIMRQWALDGQQSKSISQRFAAALAADEPPAWQGAFENLPDRLRNEVAEWYFFRAQLAYTKEVMRLRGIESMNISRAVFGDYAQKMLDADTAGAEWKTSIRTLSSWAEMAPGVKNSIKKLITRTRQDKRPPVWLTTTITPDDAFMHWAGEGVFRNWVLAKGEVIFWSRTGKMTNETVRVGDKHAKRSR